MDINSIFSQLGLGSKESVYLSITPGVGLELIQLDISSKTVKNYAYRPLEYNESLREIPDMEAFKDAMSELFAELRINPKSNIILNIPMVLFGQKDLPLLLNDDNITEALTAEAEQSYIFKRYEPSIAWCDATNAQAGDSRKIFYSAIQKNVIEDIKNALTEIGATLTGIEVSLTSVLKALAFTGLAQEQMQSNTSWNLMLISSNGYSICSMVGKNIVDYYEEPLAIKSFEGDEIYNAISASAQITLMSYPANSLFVLSETDMVSAELLSRRIQTEGQILYWENNCFKKNDPIPVSLEVLGETAHKISLEAIGCASGVSMPIKFNFLSGVAGADGDNPDESVHVVLGSLEFDISPNMARNYAILAAIVILVPALLFAFIVPSVEKHKQAQLDDVTNRLTNTNAEIEKIQKEQNKENDFDVAAEIKKVLKNNRSKLMAFTALGESVPKKLWVTYFSAQGEGQIDVKGEASNVEDIYLFFRNMKDSLLNTQLRLHKLEMKSNSVDDAVNSSPNKPTVYEFEVTNMSPEELNPPAQNQDQNGNSEQPQQDSNNNPQQEQNNNGATPPKPLLNFGK